MTTNTGATHIDDLKIDYNAPKSPTSADSVDSAKTKISDAIDIGAVAASELADSVMQKASDAGEYLKTNGNKLARSAKDNASIAAETVKANPGKTAAVIGGLVAAAAAVVAGTKLYQANAEKKPGAPRRATPNSTASKSKSPTKS